MHPHPKEKEERKKVVLMNKITLEAVFYKPFNIFVCTNIMHILLILYIIYIYKAIHFYQKHKSKRKGKKEKQNKRTNKKS